VKYPFIFFLLFFSQRCYAETFSSNVIFSLSEKTGSFQNNIVFNGEEFFFKALLNPWNQDDQFHSYSGVLDMILIRKAQSGKGYKNILLEPGARKDWESKGRFTSNDLNGRSSVKRKASDGSIQVELLVSEYELSGKGLRSAILNIFISKNTGP
jgi:hypothetical protein